MSSARSFLLKVGLLAGVIALVVFMGWRSQESPSPNLLVEFSEEGTSPPVASAGPSPAPTRVAQAAPAVTTVRPHVKAASLARARVDPNRATFEDLQTLPGIGPVLARRVVELRTTHGPFHRLEDLLEVKGIGKKRLDQLRPFVTFETGPGDKATAMPTAAGGFVGTTRD